MRWSTIERDLRSQHGPLLAGMDEVGRGPLAGPVVACAVVMPADQRAMPGINDSKQLTARKRDELVKRIRDRAVAIGIGAASVREIDRLNIYQASVLAMRRALRRLAVTPNHVVVDGKSIRTLDVRHTAVVRGDSRCYSIACASIVAKITRDRVMHSLARRYPNYSWDQNVGYATSLHLKGISAHGITPHHRKSFMPVSQISLDFSGEAARAVDESALEEMMIEDVLPIDGIDVLADTSSEATPPTRPIT
jgi:ribonuclease HII